MATAILSSADTLARLRELRQHHRKLMLDAAYRMDDKRASRHTKDAWRRQFVTHHAFVEILDQLLPGPDRV